MTTPSFEVSQESRIPGLQCKVCGYGLSGLGVDGVCPECSAPIRVSVRSDPLWNCSLADLRRVRNGLRLMRAAIVGLVLAIVAGLLIEGFGLPGRIWTVLPSIGLVLATGAYVWGTWRVVDAESMVNANPKMQRARRWVRRLSVVGVAGVLIGCTNSLVTSGSIMAQASALGGGIGLLAFLPAYCFTMLFLRELAHLLREQRAESLADGLIYGGPISVLIPLAVVVAAVHSYLLFARIERTIGVILRPTLSGWDEQKNGGAPYRGR